MKKNNFKNFFIGEKCILNKIVIFLIEIYQKFFSKDHGYCASPFCKFTPTCSEYGKECFKKYFFVKALFKTIWRVLRCNPWNKKGGVDLP